MDETCCLYVMEDWPITPDATGGVAPLIYSHLGLLARSGRQITLLILRGEHNSNAFEQFIIEQPDVWAEVSQWIAAHYKVTLKLAGRESNRLRWFGTILQDPSLHHVRLDQESISELQEIVDEIEPDLIWAEDLLAATLLARHVGTLPVVYSHNDWKWRIKKHRMGVGSRAWRNRFKFWLRKRHEEALVNRVAGCVAASASEADEIHRLGAANVTYLPTTYTARARDFPKLIPECPQIVHLGSMQTTANRLGLARFMELSWPILVESLEEVPRLFVIGSLSGISDELQESLENAGATCTGYLEDLTTVIRPYDLQIIPWEYDTGTRTRIPLAMNHGQVIVSTQAAAACLPELQHDQNCVLSRDLVQMAREIIALYSDSDRRRRLAQAGHETFLQNFTVEALQPRLEKFLSSLSETPV